ncbi:MAG: ACT domain-containing protein, partial [Defluviitaleaceae bacterium]|nr:ACT domain-containing protein [Defluviitaleaceae bacterium]
MKLEIVQGDFSVCQITSLEGVDFSREFVCLSKTDEEISLVCETAFVPPHVVAFEPGWKGLKVAGVLDFGMVGV